MNKVKRYLLPLFLFFILLFEAWAEPSPVNISIIISGKNYRYSQALDGFKKALKENKAEVQISEYNLEDENITDSLSNKIREKKPNLVFTIGSDAISFAQENIKDIPVVFSMVIAPITTTTGTNITGVTLNIPPEVTLKTMGRILPKAKKIGLIYSVETESMVKEISQVCEEIKLQLISKKINSEKDMPAVLKDMSERIDCFLIHPDSTIYSPQSTQYLLKTGLTKGFPVIGLSLSYVKAGALFSLDCDCEDIGRQSAEIALRILQGEKTDTISPLVPRKAKLCLNLVVAEILGIEIPREIIKEAAVVIKE